jgi:hypothetical protein
MKNPRTRVSSRIYCAGAAMLGLAFTAQVVMAAAPAPVTRPVLHGRVDPRVELLSIIFRLAGNDEYNQPSSKSPYSADVEKHFGKFRGHPVVLKARELASNDGVSFDAVMSMAVHIDSVESLKERVPFDSPDCKLDKRWKPSEARTFLKLAHDFVKETDFQKFLDEHQPLYAEAAKRMDQFLAKNDTIAWFDSFFGARPQSSFGVLIGMLNGGCCYGEWICLPDGWEEITPVIGCWEFDSKGVPTFSGKGILPTVIHEFCHSYTNPIVEKYAQQMEPAVKQLFKWKELDLRQHGYGAPNALVPESVVRACVVRYLRAKQGPDKAQQEISEQQQCGFEWTGELSDLVGEYESARDKYPTFDSFMPRVVQFFDDYAKKAKGKGTEKGQENGKSLFMEEKAGGDN